MTRPNDHTATGVLSGMYSDIEILKRRTARNLPERLLPTGAEVGNWNEAVNSGFYWSTGLAGAPYSGTWHGVVSVSPDGEVTQAVTNPLHPEVAWRRARMTPGIPTSFNGTPEASSLANPWALVEWQQRFSWTRSEQATGGPENGRFIRFTCPASETSNGRGWDIYGNPDVASPEWRADRIIRPVWAGETVKVTVWVRASKAIPFRFSWRIMNGEGAWLNAEQYTDTLAVVTPNTWMPLTATVTPTHTGYINVGVHGAVAGAVALVAGDTIDGALLSFEYAAGEWSEWRRSDNLLIPKRVVGGTSAATVLRPERFDPITCRYNLFPGDKYWAMDGIFTDEFRMYEILWQWFTGEANGSGFRFRQNGAEIATPNYNYQAMYVTGTGTPGAVQGTANQGTFPPNSAVGFFGAAYISEPTTTTGNQNQKRIRSEWGSWGPQQVGDVYAALGSYDQQYLDGFALYNSNQATAGVSAGAEAWITVRGVA